MSLEKQFTQNMIREVNKNKQNVKQDNRIYCKDILSLIKLIKIQNTNY